MLKPTIQLVAQICLATLVFMIFVGGSQPVAVGLFPTPWDKVVHILVFGFMLVLARAAFPKQRLIVLLIMIVAIGMLDEIHQIFLPGRSAGLDDLFADFIGGSIASIAIGYINKKK